MKENLMVVCYDYALSRRIAKSLADFFDMRFFDMFDMFNFNNAPHTLSELLKNSGREYVDKKMRSVLKTELDFSGSVFVVEPKILGLNGDLFEKIKSSNLVLFLKRDYKTEYAFREHMVFKTSEDKEYFSMPIDEMTENGENIQNTLADVVVDIDGLSFEQVKIKIQKALENFAG